MADKFCGTCGAKNKADAVVCQKCNTAFPSAGQSGSTPVVVVQQKKGGFFRKLGIGCFSLVVLVIILVIILVARSGKSGKTELTSETAAVGGTIHVPDNLDVTLNSIALSKGTQFETPHAGNEYVVTHWTFHNFRSSNTDVADTGFKVSSKGVITGSESISSLSSNQLSFAGTTLAPGATVKRDIVFQISKGAPATIIYKPADFTANWTIHGR